MGNPYPLGTPNNPRKVYGGLLKQGYKDSTRTWRVEGPPGKTQCFQRESWDGKLDARVAPRPVRLRIRNEED